LVIHGSALLHVLQDLVGLLGILEGVPLGDGPAGRGQHIGPVTQFGSSSHAPKYAAADGFGGSNTIIIHDGHNETDFLCAIGWEKCSRKVLALVRDILGPATFNGLYHYF